MHGNLATACAVSSRNSDTQSADGVSLSYLAYDLSNLCFADFKLVRYFADSLLVEVSPAKLLLRS